MKIGIISIQGGEGSFHHIAAQHLFGKNIQVLCRDSFGEVFDDVESDRATLAVVAIENSLAGSIHEVYDLMRNDDLKINSELYVRISLNLIGLPQAKIKDIKKIYSHQMALLECKSFLNNLKEVEVIDLPDTAGSVAHVAKVRDPKMAAIGSKETADIYKMKILETDIETDKQNYTRFVVLSKKQADTKATNKTSIVFTVEEKAGALHGVLGAFAERNIFLSKLESQPVIGRRWDYHFYLDFEAGLNEERSAGLLGELKKLTTSIMVLGTYNKGEII